MSEQKVVAKSIEVQIAETIGDRKVLTMYALAEVLSTFVGKRVREQQMYNYRANKRFKNLTAEGRITKADAVSFIASQVKKLTEEK